MPHLGSITWFPSFRRPETVPSVTPAICFCPSYLGPACPPSLLQSRGRWPKGWMQIEETCGRFDLRFSKSKIPGRSLYNKYKYVLPLSISTFASSSWRLRPKTFVRLVLQFNPPRGSFLTTHLSRYPRAWAHFATGSLNRPSIRLGHTRSLGVAVWQNVADHLPFDPPGLSRSGE